MGRGWNPRQYTICAKVAGLSREDQRQLSGTDKDGMFERGFVLYNHPEVPLLVTNWEAENPRCFPLESGRATASDALSFAIAGWHGEDDAVDNAGRPTVEISQIRFKSPDELHVVVHDRRLPEPRRRFEDNPSTVAGIDLNVGHLAVAIVRCDGGFLKSRTFHFEKGQFRGALDNLVNWLGRDNERGDAVADGVAVERLRFGKRNAARRFPGQRGMSSDLLRWMVRTQSEVVQVNPKYTSLVGAVKYAAPMNISTHEAAAYAIARRGLQKKERPNTVAWAYMMRLVNALDEGHEAGRIATGDAVRAREHIAKLASTMADGVHGPFAFWDALEALIQVSGVPDPRLDNLEPCDQPRLEGHTGISAFRALLCERSEHWYPTGTQAHWTQNQGGKVERGEGKSRRVGRRNGRGRG